MSKNILKNSVPVRFGRLAAHPSATENGVIYYNTTDNLFKVYEDNSWQSLASRSYVDSVAAGFDPKESVEAATLENITLAPAPASIDGVTLAAGDRVLVRAQTNKTQNGIYKLESGNLVRTVDFDDGVEVNGGEYVFVKSGNTYASTAWVVTSPDSAAQMGISEIEWTQVSGAGKSLQNAYAVGATITTSSAIGSVTIGGTQKLVVSAAQGLEVTDSMTVGAGNFSVSSSGDLEKINSIAYSFPTTQAPGTGYYLMNDGSGNLSWTETLGGFNFTNEQNGQVVRYDSTAQKWVNNSPVSTSGSSYAIMTTNASGFLDTSFLQYNVDFGGNILSGVASPSVSSDAANKGYVDRLTLDIVYGQDPDGSNAVINTTSADGSVEIAGTESLKVSSAGGLSVSLAMSAGSGDFVVSSAGDITKIKGVTYSFPSVQAAAADYTLVNDGAGNLSWATLALQGLSDVELNTLADDQIIRYNSTSGKWENESPISSSTGSLDANAIIKTNASGYLDSSFLAYNMNFGNNVLSGVATPVASNDAANKGYVDRLTLDIVYGQDADGSNAVITTTSVDGSVEIAGTESFKVSAAGGLTVSLAMSAGSGDFAVDAAGDITKIKGISYSFPAAQAAGTDYFLSNNGSGELTWNDYALSALNDVTLTGLADDQVLRYNSASSKWENESPIASSSGSLDANAIIKTNASGYLDSSFLAYNMNFGNNVLSGVASPSVSSDAANKGYVDRLTLDIVYGQDPDGSDATITTTSNDGFVVIAGTEGFKVTADKGLLVSATDGFMLADATNASKYIVSHYMDSITLTAGSAPVAAGDLSFPTATYNGALVSYRIKDSAGSNHVRVGTMLVSTNGSDVSLTDTYSETADVGVIWTAALESGSVELKYVASTSNKTMHAEVKRFLTA